MQYQFEEIPLLGKGVLASGTATFVSPGADYPGEYYVSEITFDGGAHMSRDKLPRYHETLLSLAFRVCAHHLEEQCKDAELSWIEYEQEMLCDG